VSFLPVIREDVGAFGRERRGLGDRTHPTEQGTAFEARDRRAKPPSGAIRAMRLHGTSPLGAGPGWTGRGSARECHIRTIRAESSLDRVGDERM
jgi:hypothetical protein